MEGNEDKVNWDKVRCFAELIQEEAETLVDELYEA